MNPVIKEIDEEHIAYLLTDEDRKRLSKIKLQRGSAHFEDVGLHTMCIMQAVASLTTQADERRPEGHYTDHPICVSEAIIDAMIVLNDRDDTTPRQRAHLRTLVEDILNTCPIKRKTRVLKTKVKIEEHRDIRSAAYQEAERQRRELLAPIVNEEWEWNPKTKRDEPTLSFAQGMKLIRQAAALYKSTEATHV